MSQEIFQALSNDTSTFSINISYYIISRVLTTFLLYLIYAYFKISHGFILFIVYLNLLQYEWCLCVC